MAPLLFARARFHTPRTVMRFTLGAARALRQRTGPPRYPATTGAARMIAALLSTLSLILSLVWWVFLVMIIMSWLISFNVINTRNQFVAAVWRVLNQITEPILRPIRRVIPPLGGMDLSPLIVFIIIFFLQNVIAHYAVTGSLI